MSGTPDMVFKSKVDTWLWITIGLLILVCSVASILALWEVKDMWGMFFVAALILTGVVFPLWLMKTYYVVSEGVLRVHAGPFCWKIPATEISKIEKTWSILSSPAMSFDRITVHYSNGKEMMISPLDKQGLCRALGKNMADQP